MPTVRNIANIKANLLHPALTSHFEVTIPNPPGLTNDYLTANGLPSYAGLQEQLNLMCSEATLPGSNLATFEINDNFHGVTERHAYRRIYDDRIDLTFYVNADNYMPIRYFEIWMKYIAGESLSPGGGMLGSKDPSYFYRVRYPKDYMCKQGLQVIKFERTGDTKNERYISKPLIYEFINSYPISITSMPVSYDSSSLLKCTVSLSYIRYLMMPTGTDPAPTATTSSIFTGDPSSPNFTATPQQIAQVNSFNSNIDLSSITGRITPGGVPFDSAGASQASNFTLF
jgi:hypothetical protein